MPSNALSQFFSGRSPIDPANTYWQRPNDCACHNWCNSFDAVIANDWVEAERLATADFSLERDADKLKKECPGFILPKSLS